MTAFRHLHTETDNHNILWLRLDVRNTAINLLTPEAIDELAQACTLAQQQKPRALILCSAKPSGFMAGIDLKRLTTLAQPAQALACSQTGQALCQQFADLPFPTLAMIDGFCLGGGLELALALDYRIASNNPTTRLGLPEVKLGIHPGFGGTVRSIALLGVFKAMGIMLSGNPIAPQTALKLGLLDACVPEQQLRNTAAQTVLHAPPKRKPALHLRLLNQFAPARWWVARQLRQQAAAYANPTHYPAPDALIALWEKHGANPQAMYRAEAESVAQLVQGATAQNLVRVFFLQNRLKALGNQTAFHPQHVHVIGGDVIGSEIAAWCAIQGLQVSLQDQNAEALARGITRAKAAIQQHYPQDSHAAQTALDRLAPDVNGTGIAKADVIIEAVSEHLAAKQQLFQMLEQKAQAHALLATNTASIPLEAIAEALHDPKRLVGLHFLYPIAQTAVLEVVYAPQAYDTAVVDRASAFARCLDKLPLPVKSSPGFLVNRVLMPYLLEGIRLQQQGIPAAVIDAAARSFGMAQGPLELADNIGLDICLQVSEALAKKLKLDLPLTLNHMTKAGKLGKKSGEGFYRYRHGKILQHESPTWHGNRALLQNKLVTPLVNEAKACLAQGIVEDADVLDAGIIFGTGFAPFLGGPLHYAKT